MRLDHIAVAARTLEDGAAFIERVLGVPTVPGGKHPRLGTHNRLLNLGDGIYLEVIAIDPEGGAPFQPRWFGLDDPALQARLAQGPVLVNWAARTDDIVVDAAHAPFGPVPVHEMARGNLRWRITIPADGLPPGGGVLPTLIQWDTDDHPTRRMPESGCRVMSLRGWHPDGQALFGGEILRIPPCVEIGPISRNVSPLLEIVFETPRGQVVLSSDAAA